MIITSSKPTKELLGMLEGVKKVAIVGITDFAQGALGDVVYINLPEVGDTVAAGESFGDVESVKAVSDVNSPVTGVIAEINKELIDSAVYEVFCAEAG